jgi:hypothetical protein
MAAKAATGIQPFTDINIDRLQQQYLAERRADKQRRARRKAETRHSELHDGEDDGRRRTKSVAAEHRTKSTSNTKAAAPATIPKLTPNTRHSPSKAPSNQLDRIKKYYFTILVNCADANSDLEEILSLPTDRMREVVTRLTDCEPANSDLHKNLRKLREALRPSHPELVLLVNRIRDSSITATANLLAYLQETTTFQDPTNPAVTTAFATMGRIKRILNKVAKTLFSALVSEAAPFDPTAIADSPYERKCTHLSSDCLVAVGPDPWCCTCRWNRLFPNILLDFDGKHSLTRQEKRHFKRFCGRCKGDKYF